MYKRERPVSPSSSTSTIGNARVPPMENDLIDSFSLLQSEKAVQEIIQQPVLRGVDDHLVEFSEALRTVAKALRRVTEDKASAQAEAAEWKRKYKIERAHNLQLERKGGHCCELNVERSQESQDQAVLSDATREQCELCSGKDDICAHEVLQDCEPDSESSAVPKAMVMKGEKGDCHKHEIVDFARGNITAAHSNKQISLKWESPPHTVLVLNKPNSATVQSLCLEMVRWLKEHTKLNIFVEPRVKAELLAASSYYGFVQTWPDDKDMLLMQAKVNLVVTLGGDGTVLWAASMFKGPVPPIVSFSVGSLGFMTPFSSVRYPECLNSILHNPFSVTLRHRLQCHIIRDAAETETDIEGPMLVLNEVTIDRGISSFLTNLECYCDNSFVTRVHGDGLILSTASGSTAYSLAAGGSMVHPQVPGILFTPICPHSLSFRPLMLPENVTLRVAVPFNSRSQAWVSFDGKGRKKLAPGDALVCSVAPWPVPTVCLVDPTHDFLRSIQDDLHWNLSKSVL